MIADCGTSMPVPDCQFCLGWSIARILGLEQLISLIKYDLKLRLDEPSRGRACSVSFKAMSGRLLLLTSWLKELHLFGMAHPGQTATARYALCLA